MISIMSDYVVRPTLRQLEYAVAVADLRHFGRAAEACHVSQPGLSAQVLQLEDHLGVQIFERARRQVLLTPEGEEVIARARKVLEAADALVEIAREKRHPLEGPLRLGVIPTVAPYVLPAVLPEVRRAFPKLRLILREDQTHRLVEQIVEGRLDLLLLALPLHSPELEEVPLFDEPFVLAAPRGHALAKGNAVKEKDLAGEELLLLDEGHCLRDQALDVCGGAGAHESEAVRATSLNTLVQMVENGLGATLLPASAVPVELREGSQIVVRPFVEPQPQRTLGLAFRKSTGRRESFTRLGELLRGQVKQLQGLRAR